MSESITHHFMEDLMPLIVLPVMTLAMAWVIGAIVGAFKHRAQLRAQTDFHNKMIDKFGSAEEFTAYLQSEAGKGFFDKLSVEPASPLSKILSSIKTGLILTLIGLGLIFLSPQFPGPDIGSILTLLGVISLATGLGFLISSVISYRLAKGWGLITAGNAPAVNTPKTVAPTA